LSPFSTEISFFDGNFGRGELVGRGLVPRSALTRRARRVSQSGRREQIAISAPPLVATAPNIRKRYKFA
jgi:hypothetical protein